VPLVDQGLDDGDDAADVVGGLGFHGRFGQPQAVHILVKGLDVAIGDRAVIDPLLVGAIDDLVVDVGVVADVGHVVAGIFQVAVDNVKDHVGAGMADVAVVIDGDAADVHAGLAGDQGDKDFFFTREGVVDAQ